MAKNDALLEDMVGKMVLVKTHGGFGTKDASLMAGEYKGLLLGFDGTFLKLEYDVRKFISGANVISKDVLLINVAYVVTVNEYINRDD